MTVLKVLFKVVTRELAIKTCNVCTMNVIVGIFVLSTSLYKNDSKILLKISMRICCYLVHGPGLEVIAYIPGKQEPVSTIHFKSNVETGSCLLGM